MKTLLGLALISAAVTLATLPAATSPDAPLIAPSIAYFGNIWRTQMVEAFEQRATRPSGPG
jgi:ribose transport system substrate-binding protein